MFSFFRRSKRDPDTGPSKDNRDRKGKDKDPARGEENKSPTRSRKDMCKNKSSTQNAQNAPQGGTPSVAAETVLRENACLPVTSDNVTTVTDINDSTQTNTDSYANFTNRKTETMSASQKISEVPVLSYASVTKNSDTLKDKLTHTSNVKPCGHGTLAISPRIPVPIGKAHHAGTPPESPKLEVKNKQNLLKKPSEVFEDAISVNAAPLRHNEPEETLDELNSAPECTNNVKPVKLSDDSSSSAPEDTSTDSKHRKNDGMYVEKHFHCRLNL